MPQKLLTFLLGADEYALDVAAVQEIVALTSLTPLPDTEADVLGVMELRGSAIPVLDLHSRLGRVPESAPANGVVVVVARHGGRIGMLVDRVLDVAEIDERRVEPAPCLGTVPSRLVSGLLATTGRVRVLLDIDAVLRDRTPSDPALAASAAGAWRIGDTK